MEKPVHILHALLIFNLLGAAAASDQEGWWSIDCGAGGGSRVVNGSISWVPDTNYTKVGTNARLPQNQALEEMNTLRFFPNKTENNCYIVPIEFPGFNYIVRAGFYYGNYDGLSKPPTFDLKLDRENWTTVNTSSTAKGGIPIYQEAIYLTRSGNLTVCLEQTRDGEVPFISSLEGVPINYIYDEVLDTTTATLHLVARTNFGGPEIRFPDDNHNRIWTRGITPPNCHANVSTPIGYSLFLVNDEPVSMLLDYIESTKVNDPIILTVDIPPQSTPLPAYFVFYLADLSYHSNGSDIRAMQIYINGLEMSTVTVYFDSSKAVTVYPLDVMGPTINITLVATDESNLPPNINGIEIFTRHDLVGQSGSPLSPYSSSDTSKHFLSIYALIIYIICLVALFP